MRTNQVTLQDDEALVVAPIDFWNHLLDVFEESAKEFPEQAGGWWQAHEHVKGWVEQTRS